MRIDEKIGVYNELNPLLFKNGELIKEVREKILKITEEFLTGLEDEELQTQVIDIRIVGSNASYNYTDTSDLDVHIELQVSNLNNPLLYYKLYTAYKSIFNNKYNLTIKGIPVEIYVDFEGTLPTSNGIYSVMKNEWIKEPVKSIIPEIEDEEFNNKFKIWEKRYNEIVDKIKNELNISLEESLLVEDKESFEDLFLRVLKKRNNINIDAGDVEAGIATFNKGIGSFNESIEEEDIDYLSEIESFINNIYQVRKNSIAKDGEYGIGNLIFKQFRAMGYLKNLRELRRKLKEKELSLEGYSLNEELLNEAKADLELFSSIFGEKAFNDFTKYKQRIKNAGISTDYVWHTKYTSKQDMERILYNIARGRSVDAEAAQKVNEEGHSTTGAFNKTVRGDFEYLGNSGGYDIYWVKSYEAAMDLGVNAGWCTSGRYGGGAGNPSFIPDGDSARTHFDELVESDTLAHFYHYLDPKTHYAKYALIVYDTSPVDRTGHFRGIKGYEDVVSVKTNCEVYDYRDNLAFDVLDELPVDLLLLKPQVLTIRQSDFNKDGLYIDGETLIEVNPTIRTIFNEDIKFIGELAFYNYRGLKEVSLPNVKEIGKNAFYSCYNLEQVSLPNVEKIGKYAFSRCMGLKEVSLPNVKEIGVRAFYGCMSLKEVSLPNAEEIGRYTFNHCKSLKEVSLPNVKEIEVGAFDNCESLEKIYTLSGNTVVIDFFNENYDAFRDVEVIFIDSTTLVERKLEEAKEDQQKLVYFAGNSLAKRFFDLKNKNRLKSPENDIYYWLKKTPLELEKRVTEIENTLSRSQERKISKLDGAELVAKNSNWEVYRIETHNASCFYGKGTKWCTAGKDSTYFDSYKKQGIVLYYIISDNKKYAIALYPKIIDALQENGVKANFELFDEEDNAIRDNKEIEKILNKFPKIPNVELVFEFLPAEIKDNVLIRVYPHSSGEFIIPSSVTSIGDEAFYGCSSLTSIIIPSSVRSIGDIAFYNCTSLTSITIPDSVTSIGEGAFFYCTSLTSIEIPDSVTSIGNYAFRVCTSLTSIIIPDSVTSIGNYAFGGCTRLTSITIPDSVTSIGDYAFYYCPRLTIYAEAESKPERWHRAWNPGNRPIIWNYKENSSKRITENTLMETLLEVLNEAKEDQQKLVYFAGNSLAKRFFDLKNKNRLKSPENDIYYWLKKTPLELEKRVTEIENTLSRSQERKISKLDGAELVAKNSYWEVYRIDTHIASCFYGKGTKWCTAGRDSTYFDSYKEQGIVLYYIISDNKKYAIALYPKIVDALQEYGVKANFELFDEEDNAIRDNEELEKILNKFPKIPNVELIFEFLPAEIKDNVLIRVYPHSSGEFIIPDSVTRIGNSAFYDCSSLTSIIIPDSVTSIGNYAFWGCTSLTSITIPDSVRSIGDFAFEGCTSLTSIEIPDSVRSIGSNVFFYCSSLTSITIPDSVTSIGDCEFFYCTSLTSIEIPDSVTSIGNYAFAGCTSLTSIEIPDSVISMGKYAFGGCTSLTSIIIPDSVRSIGSNAFYNCASLTSITIPDSVRSIGDFAFEGCTSLTSITIPDSVTSISSNAFYNCHRLTIYAEAESKPERWHQAWNPGNRPIIWNYKENK